MTLLGMYVVGWVGSCGEIRGRRGFSPASYLHLVGPDEGSGV